VRSGDWLGNRNTKRAIGPFLRLCHLHRVQPVAENSRSNSSHDNPDRKVCLGIGWVCESRPDHPRSSGLFLVFHSPEKCARPERFGRIFWIVAALLVEIPFPCSLPIGAKKEPNVTASAMRRFFLVRGGGMRRSGTTMP
jgi:hypothetical protein